MKKSMLVSAMLMSATTAIAEAPAAGKTTVGVSLDASVLLGVGLSVGTPLPYNLNARAMVHSFNYSRDFEDQGGNYDGKLKLNTVGAMLDYHPFAGVFRLTAGLMSNGNKINLKGVANSNSEYQIGDCYFTSNSSNPLTVNGDVGFNSLAPYLGFGWGGNMNAEPGFYGLFDLGVMFSGAPAAKLNASGSAVVSNNPNNAPNGCTPGTLVPDATSHPTVQRELRDAETAFNDKASNYKLWPNISFGLGWRF